jgi:hypothetical protein
MPPARLITCISSDLPHAILRRTPVIQVPRTLTLRLKIPGGTPSTAPSNLVPLLTAGLPLAVKLADGSVALDMTTGVEFKRGAKIVQKTQQGVEQPITQLLPPTTYRLLLLTQGAAAVGALLAGGWVPRPAGRAWMCAGCDRPSPACMPLPLRIIYLFRSPPSRVSIPSSCLPAVALTLYTSQSAAPALVAPKACPSCRPVSAYPALRAPLAAA